MLSNIFIAIGGVFLGIYNFLKNFSFKELTSKSAEKEEMDSRIFSNIIFDENPSKINKDSKFEVYRSVMIPYLLNRYFIVALAVVVFLVAVFLGLDISAILLILILMAYFYILQYPKIQTQKSYSDLNQELPYALRHIGVELKSGKGLHDSLITIKNSDYGSLSDEFNRVLEEVKYGKSTEDSLLEMSHRVDSEGLSRTIQQIIGTLRVGGNLASSLEIIAKDITFDMHIKLKEYSQKLNSFILIYTFIAILIPVVTLIMLMASTTVMGDIVPGNVVLMLYSLFFPMLVIFMGIFMKRMEPKI